jgi:ornithine cyclodeaminase
MLRVIDREDIAQVLDLRSALACVERSFRLFSEGAVSAPLVSHIPFAEPPGDCHVKAAHVHGEPVFAVKVSNGFYRNPLLGLPSSNGLVLVFSAATGAPLAVLEDRGLITDMRTALAGVVVSSLARPNGIGTVGIVGAGTQARLQLEYLHRLRGPLKAGVWSRSAEELGPYVDDMRQKGIEPEAFEDLAALCAESDVLITTTPATSPLLQEAWVSPGTHITAVGADAKGKQELDPRLFGRARGILVDSREQCVDHAEVCRAVTAGIVRPESLVEIGEALAGKAWQLNPAGDITIADLSGLGATDALLAQAAWKACSGAPDHAGG